jgi:hypothetical protein
MLLESYAKDSTGAIRFHCDASDIAGKGSSAIARI